MPHHNGKINFARLATSARLQRLHKLLITGREYTTMEIINLANIAAVSAAVSELRENGFDIICRFVGADPITDSRTYSYQMQGVA